MKKQNQTKKITGIIICMLLLLSSIAVVVSAQDIEIGDEDGNLGDPDLNIKISEMTWLDKLKVSFGNGQSFTVIDGATCSRNPDKSNQFTISGSGSVCYTNTKHIGVAFQLFRIDDTGRYRYVGEKQLEKGDKGCFEDLSSGEYSWDLYYCDSTIERKCSDTDNGKDYNKKGTVTFELGSEKDSYDDTCSDSQNLLERYCDSDNSVSTVTKECACDNGECSDEGGQTTGPGEGAYEGTGNSGTGDSGSYCDSSLYAGTSVTKNCVVPIGQNFQIKNIVVDKPLSIFLPYVKDGKYILEENQDYNIKVTIINRGSPGTQYVEVGYYDENADWLQAFSLASESVVDNCRINEVTVQTKKITLQTGQTAELLYHIKTPKVSSSIDNVRVGVAAYHRCYTNAVDNDGGSGSTSLKYVAAKISRTFNPYDLDTYTGQSEEDACTNTFIDNSETDYNCGGKICQLCDKGQKCLVDNDCKTGLICLDEDKRCFDEITPGYEVGKENFCVGNDVYGTWINERGSRSEKLRTECVDLTSCKNGKCETATAEEILIAEEEQKAQEELARETDTTTSEVTPTGEEASCDLSACTSTEWCLTCVSADTMCTDIGCLTEEEAETTEGWTLVEAKGETPSKDTWNAPNTEIKLEDTDYGKDNPSIIPNIIKENQGASIAIGIILLLIIAGIIGYVIYKKRRK